MKQSGANESRFFNNNKSLKRCTHSVKNQSNASTNQHHFQHQLRSRGDKFQTRISQSAHNSPRTSFFANLENCGAMHSPVHGKISTSTYEPQPPPYPYTNTTNCLSLNDVTRLSSSQEVDDVAKVNDGREWKRQSYSTNSASQFSNDFQEIREVNLKRNADEPYGLRVEFIGNSFYVTQLIRNSVATFAGLKVGDKLIRVNEHSLVNCSLSEVLTFIRESDENVNLAYKPRAVLERIREVHLQKVDGILGLRLKQKIDGMYIDFVKISTPASVAGLKEGDQVLKIDNDCVTNWSTDSAMSLLKSIPEDRVFVFHIKETLPLAHVNSQEPHL